MARGRIPFFLCPLSEKLMQNPCPTIREGTLNSAKFNPSSSYQTGLGASCVAEMRSGTSMATPVVAGSAALVRQYFEEGFYPTQVRHFSCTARSFVRPFFT